MKKKRHYSLPIVALVGRPNVGKSRLFNRFVGKPQAIVENTPGVTRDRNYGEASWERRHFMVIDTGGFEPESKDVLLEQMRDQAQLAVEEASVILFVVDGRAGVLPADLQIADILRKTKKRVILVINKVDQPKLEHLSYEFYELAFPEQISISAEHGYQFGELADAVIRDMEAEPEEESSEEEEEFPDDQTDEQAWDEDTSEEEEMAPEDGDESEDGEDDWSDEGEDEDEENVRFVSGSPVVDPREALEAQVLNETICIAVLGKPNTGKSTLINRLLGYQRLLTADIAGTTRDTIDSPLTDKDGQRYVLVDTAGIRRKHTISQRIEKFSIIKALDAVERADVALLVVDANVGLTDQDLVIASICMEKGCALAVLLNKWDAVSDKTEHPADERIKDAKEKLSFCNNVPIITMSALTGMRTHKILSIAKKLYVDASMRIKTGELNRAFKEILLQHSPPLVGTRTLKFYYIQQVSIRPPTFVIQSNAPELIPTDYKRYITNKIRQFYGFAGSPLRIIFRRPAGRRKWEK